MTKVLRPVCLMVVLALVLSIGVMLAPVVQADKGDDSGSGTVVVTNGIYTLSVEDTSSGIGTYTVSTGSSHPNPGENVLYGGAAENPWSTYLTVRVYETSREYVSVSGSPTPSAGYTVVNLDTCSPSVSQTGNEIHTTWTTPESLVIEQVTAVEGTTLDDSRVRVTTTVTNNSGTAYNVGIRYEWDLMINGDDDSWFREINPDGSWTNTEIAFEPPSFETFETTNNPSSPLFNVIGSVTGPATLTPTPDAPDRLVYAGWSNAYSAAFDYTPVPLSGYDSAVLYYWGNTDTNKIALSASGGGTSVTQYLFALPAEEEEVVPPPVAGLMGEPPMGQAPHTVQFRDQSSGDIDSWYWSFGDGENSTSRYPSHTYQNEGTYTVCLTVTGPGGSDTACLTDHVIVESMATPADLVVRNLNISATYAQPRQEVQITADVANEGGSWGSDTVDLMINGQYEQSANVGVSPGTSQPISFTVYKVTAGEYQVQVGDAMATFYVMEERAETQRDRAGSIPLGTGGIIAIIVVGVIVVGAVVFLIVRLT